MSEKEHISIIFCGHVDSGKSTTAGRLLFELGGIPEREMEKLKQEAERLGKESFAFAFYMDRQKEERSRGVTIAATNKEFFTERWHYTLMDGPGHRDFIKNMIRGASQADVALLFVPADGGFVTSIAKGDWKTGEVQGQTRQHARLVGLLGIQQVCVAVNKMDSKTAGYAQDRFEEIRDEVKSMLPRLGLPKIKSYAFIPMSGWTGDNLLKKSSNMGWWKGMTVQVGKRDKVDIVTLYDFLDKVVQPPRRQVDKPMRMPVSGIYKIKGVGDVVSGRVEQGVVKCGEEVVFMPTHTPMKPCVGKVFTVESHHSRLEKGNPGDIVGLNIKGLNKNNMPRAGDVMIYKRDTTLGEAQTFDAQVQVLELPGQGVIKTGFAGLCCVRTGKAPCRLTEIKFSVSRAGRVVAPPNLKSGEGGLCSFQPLKPLVVESFKSCQGLARIAIMDHNEAVMLGKVVAVDTLTGKEVTDAFRKFDKDGNGTISKEELTAVLKQLDPSWNDASLDKLMAGADKNKDGSLQIGEFVNWLFRANGGKVTS